MDAAHGHIRAIARTAYIFAYPLVMHYGDLYAQVIDRSSPTYSGGFGTWRHAVRTPLPAGCRPSETLYSVAWFDVGAGPSQVRLPAGDRERGTDVRITDLWGHVLVECTLGKDGGTRESLVMLASPRWTGEVPGDVDRVVRGESSLLRMVVATEVRTERDELRATERHETLAVRPIRAGAGRGASDASSSVAWLAWRAGYGITNHFWSCANFALLLTERHPKDETLLARLAEIGVVPGEPWDSAWFGVGMLEAISAGMDDALTDLLQAAGGPLPLECLGGSRREGDGDLFGRAVSALVDPLLIDVAASGSY